MVEFSLHQIMFIYSLGLAKEQKKTVQTLRPSNAPPPTATQANKLIFSCSTQLKNAEKFTTQLTTTALRNHMNTNHHRHESCNVMQHNALHVTDAPDESDVSVAPGLYDAYVRPDLSFVSD